MMKYLLTFLVISCAVSCKQDATGDKTFTPLTFEGQPEVVDEKELFTLLDATQTGITFSNNITEIEDLNIIVYEYLYNGGGVAAGDINNDGLIDLYFIGNMELNQLYLNLGDFKFRNITAASGADGGQGFKTGVTMVDINQDGWLDIYICKSMIKDPQYRRNILYINNRNLTFTERAAEYGLDDASYSTQAYFFDMDTDGDLDMYLVNHPAKLTEANNINLRYNAAGELELFLPEDLSYITDRLYENDNNRYTDISQKAGVLNEAFGLSAVVADFNGDLRPDIYVCNDYIKPDYLYINNGDKTFTDKFSESFQQSAFSSMGSDFADINNDGCPDLITVDMLPRDHYRQNMLSMVQNYDKFQKMTAAGLKAQYSANVLQLSDCNGNFSNIAYMSNTAYSDWSWSALFADYNNDGWKDLYISNGYRRDITNLDYARYSLDSLRKEYHAKNTSMVGWVESIPSQKVKAFLMRNDGNLHFSDVSGVWNSGPPAFSNGAAYVDLNNDGYLDLVTNNINDPAFIFRNDGKNSRNNNFIRFKLAAKRPGASSAWGSRVRIYNAEGQIQEQMYYPTRGFLSSVEPIVHFGLGQTSAVTSAEIIWPDGSVQVVDNPAVNTVNEISENPTGGKYRTAAPKSLFFEDVSNNLPEVRHTENEYIDFKREPMLHHKYSEEGPAGAAGDINGDGLDDVFVGGSMGSRSQLLIQQRNGNYLPLQVAALAQDSAFEDVAALIFDANGDGANDLLVVSGGNEKPLFDAIYQDRLYLNDGKGVLTRASDALPPQLSSGGCVAGGDIDGDGDMDLFIGGRVSPGKFPVPPTSTLLRNDGGKFTNVTNEMSEGLITLGMLTDATFADLDKNGSLELIITGEWMPVTVFKLVGQKYVNVSKEMGLTPYHGWWYSVAVGDLNGDGFPEIIAGNLGLNSHIRTGPNKPVTLHYDDFDKNGSIDPIMCCFYPDTSYPVHFRDRLLDQMIVLKKKFTRYNQYANATIEDILTEEQLKSAKVLSANTFAHTLFVNEGGKGFQAQSLPRYTQISSVRSIKVMDVNADGHMDLVIGGNLYATDAQLGRYDASLGAVLIGDGTTTFQIVSPPDSGFKIPGNVRNILTVKTSGGRELFIVRNGDTASLFRLKNG